MNRGFLAPQDVPDAERPISAVQELAGKRSGLPCPEVTGQGVHPGIDWTEEDREALVAGIEAAANAPVFVVSENEVMDTLRQLYAVRRALTAKGNTTEGAAVDQIIGQVASILNGSGFVWTVGGPQ